MQSSLFLDVLEAQARVLPASHPAIEFEFTRGPVDREKTGAWLEMTTPRRLGQVTVWSSGECEIEADASDGSVLLRRSVVLESPDDLKPALDELARLLG